MAVIMGGRRFLGYDLSGYRRVGQRGPLAGLGEDLEAKVKYVKDNPFSSAATLLEIKDMLGGGLSTSAIAKEIADGALASRSPGNIAQRLLAQAAGGGGGVRAARSLDDLARGKVRGGDTIGAVPGLGTLRVINVEYDKDNVVVAVNVEAGAARGFDVYDTVSKGVTSDGTIFYEQVQHLVAPGGPPPNAVAARRDGNTKSFYLTTQVGWNGFVRSPGATRLLVPPANYVATFGSVRRGTTLRTEQSWFRGSSLNEGSVEERVFLDAEKAESDAAVKAARAGKDAMAIRADAESARAMTIMSGMGVRTYEALPRGFQSMLTKGAANRAGAALGAGVPPPSPGPAVPPPQRVVRSGPPWGTIAAVTGGVLVVAGLITVFARRRRG